MAAPINDLEYEYYNHPSKDTAYMFLHGVRGGIDESYITTSYGAIKARNDTVLVFNFPYMTRGEDRVSGISFSEELGAVQVAYDFLKSENKTRVHIIGKSLGGIILSHWLENNPAIKDVDASIMGYIPGPENIIPGALRGRLKFVIQGEHDRYASPEQVRDELAAHKISGEVIEISHADHSYRDMVNANPEPYAYQGQAIAELLKHI